MPITSPGNDDDTGENHQPTLRKNTAEPVEQTLKQNKFFHKRSFQGVSIDEFITLLDEYMVWYRDKRIKLEYGMSIMDKRIQLGLVA